MGNDEKLGSKTVPMTPPTPMAHQQNLDPERPPTTATILEFTSLLAIKYTRYSQLLIGEVGCNNQRREIFQANSWHVSS